MKPHKFLLFFINLFFISCINDVDFDQADDIEINTPYLISLAYFTADVDYFLNDLGNETLFVSDTTDFPIFEGSYNENYLIQADFQFKISNTFNRSVAVQIKFLDENDADTYVLNTMNIPMNVIDFENTQIIVEADIPFVLLTEKIVFNVLLDSGSTPIDSSQGMGFELQSAATLYYQISGDDE